MFTDIVGFTEFTALRGDGEAMELLALQDRIVRAELPPGRSRIVKELGDGLMLWFEASGDAIRTGLRLQERFEEESLHVSAPLWVRIGIHTGTQTCRGDDLIGHDVNIAARIVGLADSGEVLVSEATRDGAEGLAADVCFAQLGPVVMKGIPTPVNLYRCERNGD